MEEFIRSLRAKQEVKTLADYRKEIESLKFEVRRLNTILYNREKAFNGSLNRVLTFLRRLTEVKGSDLKKAVSIIVYWDDFSSLDAVVVERLREEDSRIKAFFDLPRQFGNIKAMKKYVGTKELADALKLFGYGDKAEIRAKPPKENKKKSSKKKGAK